MWLRLGNSYVNLDALESLDVEEIGTNLFAIRGHHRKTTDFFYQSSEEFTTKAEAQEVLDDFMEHVGVLDLI